MSESSLGSRGRLAASAAPSRIASRLDTGLKRAIDLVVSSALLVFLLPVWLLFCIAIKLESSGPVLYRARRIGWRGKTVCVLKFRKMYDGATGTALTGNADPRFTRLGRFLARTKLDEVPQLLNVVRGEMSLVGPRPEDPSFVALHDGAYEEINSVRPGITGLGQLAFARESDILDPADAVGHYVGKILPQKVGLDLLYSRSRTLRGDFRILLWTVMPVILRVDVAVNRETGALTVRRRKRSLASSNSS